ncbi:MAG: DNA topoisomerase I, partial [Prevotellaceae bacterium]|nr:DNA topoisomerase I [Prevotellaceae bacterium]
QREYVVKGEKSGEKRAYNLLSLQQDKIKDTTRTETTGAEKSKLLPTDTGTVVTDFLIACFPGILDYNFTASIEKEFDEIAEGQKEWTAILSNFYRRFHPVVESTLAAKSEHKAGERVLGEEPGTGKPVSVKIGRFGPVAQIGSSTDEEKPRFAQLKNNMSIETITLEQALDLFKLPRTLGEFEGKEVVAGAGRFGPYIHLDKLYVSLPAGMDPLTVSLEEAVPLIVGKREAEAKKHLKKFAEEPELEIMNGRFGPYITYKGNNYKIPKKTDPATLSLADCMELIKKQEGTEAAPKTKARRTKAATKGKSKA